MKPGLDMGGDQREFRLMSADADVLVGAKVPPHPYSYYVEQGRFFHEGVILRESAAWWSDYLALLDQRANAPGLRELVRRMRDAGVADGERVTRGQRIEVLANRARVVGYVEQVVRRKWAKQLMGDDITQEDVKAHIIARLDIAMEALVR